MIKGNIFKCSAALLVYACLQSPALAQSSFKLSTLRVTGSQRFEELTLVRATGLQAGQEVSEGALKEAADRLASPGMFTNVEYTYTEAPTGTVVEFQVKDRERLLPASFDNFVWLSREQLLSELRKREPLFTGDVPNAGSMFQRLADDLKAILAERGVIATVDGFPVAPMTGGGITGFIYTVQGVRIPIRRVEFPGASPEMTQSLEKTSTPLLDGDFAESRLRAFCDKDLLPQYQMRGYLHAGFDGAQAQVVEPSTNAVAVRVPVHEGLQYKLTGVRWHGNSAYSASDLSKSLNVRVGQPADKVQLDEDLARMQLIYGTRGYLDAHVETMPVFDDHAATVSFDVDIVEGEQYHMGNLRFEGISDSSANALSKLWKLKPGDTFSTAYAQLFLQGASLQLDLSRVNVEVTRQPHRDTRTVDLVLRFTPRK